MEISLTVKRFPECEDFETSIEEYFKDLGYYVINTHIYVYQNYKYELFLSEHQQMIIDKFKLQSILKRFEAGLPDLLVFDENEFFFVECKREGDALHINQIKWMNIHKNYKTYVAWGSNKIKDYILWF